jgi:opacity protein-like surface antigen
MKKFLLSVATVACAASAMPALAKVHQVNSGPIACTLGDLASPALQCSGFYAGNVLNNNKITEQFTGLGALGFNWDKNFTALESAGLKYNLPDSKTVNLNQTLTGISYLGIHFGGGGPNGAGNATAFYKIDVGSGLTSFLVKYQGISGIAIYSTGNVAPPPPPPAVPEPATWALLISGFGLVGAAARRRNRPAALA